LYCNGTLAAGPSELDAHWLFTCAVATRYGAAM